MSRTIREVRVAGRNPEEVKEHIALWFAENYFDVKEWSSKGKRGLVYEPNPSWAGVNAFVISPKIGSTVAVRIDTNGCIVFEITMKEEGSDTVVHGEFYVATIFSIFGGDWDLVEHSTTIGQQTREYGYVFMTSFTQSLEDFSNNSAEPQD